MKYSEMSDAEINNLVAWKSGLYERDDSCEGYAVGLGGDDYRLFNPCNSWADAGPIIDENQICLSFDRWREDPIWSAGYDGHDDYEWSGEWMEFSDKNPLRAAMIVFLMMQEAKC